MTQKSEGPKANEDVPEKREETENEHIIILNLRVINLKRAAICLGFSGMTEAQFLSKLCLF